MPGGGAAAVHRRWRVRKATCAPAAAAQPANAQAVPLTAHPHAYQVKYVVELAKALSLHPSVYRVDLLTRLIE